MKQICFNIMFFTNRTLIFRRINLHCHDEQMPVDQWTSIGVTEEVCIVITRRGSVIACPQPACKSRRGFKLNSFILIAFCPLVQTAAIRLLPWRFARLQRLRHWSMVIDIIRLTHVSLKIIAVVPPQMIFCTKCLNGILKKCLS